LAARFCSQCGAPLKARELDGRPRGLCPRCGWVEYEQPKLGAGALIEQDGRLLLLQRTRKPFAGHWNLPAGYVEVDERPVETVVRQVREETGLHVEPVQLRGAYFFDDDPRGSGVLIVYRCRVTGGMLGDSDEARYGRYLSREELADALAGGGHDQAVRDWSEARER